MMDLLDENFKAAILHMFKEPKEDMEKVKNSMCAQNGNIHKEKENLKKTPNRNSGAEQYNNKN